MGGCTTITGKAFEYLRGIHTLVGSTSTIAKAKRVLGNVPYYEEDNDYESDAGEDSDDPDNDEDEDVDFDDDEVVDDE